MVVAANHRLDRVALSGEKVHRSHNSSLARRLFDALILPNLCVVLF
nr:MAG TPA: hypothetical protein [Caudoviricetes sp.]